MTVHLQRSCVRDTRLETQEGFRALAAGGIR